MKHIALVAVTGLIFTGGMFAGLVEKQVAEVRGEAPISEAHALDNAEVATCKGMTTAMCFPANCSDGNCPSNNQCTGLSHCRALVEVVGPGQTLHDCTTYGHCDSSEQSDDEEELYSDSWAKPVLQDGVMVSVEAMSTKPRAASRLYTSYY